MAWSESMVATLRSMHKNKENTYKDIALVLGISKNAVEGKASRLGLEPRTKLFRKTANGNVITQNRVNVPIVGSTLPPLPSLMMPLPSFMDETQDGIARN